MRATGFATLFFALATGLVAAGARADDHRLVVVSPGAELHEALETALTPWDVEIIVDEGEVPGATMPDVEGEARALAARHHARVVAWVSTGGSGPALFVYDVGGARLVARSLRGGPPFTPESAASLALSVKTLLRHSEIAPPRQRYGSETAETEQAPSRSPYRLASIVGLRIGRDGLPDPELRLGLGLSFWPVALDDLLGLTIEVLAGPGREARAETFAGRWVDVTIALSLAVRVLRVGIFSVLLGARLETGITMLDGAVLATRERASVLRIDPAAGLSLALGVAVRPGLVLGLRAGGNALLVRQRYLVQGEPVYELSPVAFDAALSLDVAL